MPANKNAIKVYKEVIPFPIFSYDIEVMVTEPGKVCAANTQEYNFQFTNDQHSKYEAFHSALHQNVAERLQVNAIITLPYDVTVGTVAHECHHAVHHMLKYIGAEQDEEIISYCLGYLVRNVEDIVEIARKKLKVITPRKK